MEYIDGMNKLAHTLGLAAGVTMLAKSAQDAQSYNPMQLYNALASVETESERNPWIRTKVRPVAGSTAYGPVQLTGNKLNDYTARHRTMFDAKELEYAKRLSEQARLFNQHGGTKGRPGYNAAFDYGGQGTAGSTPEDQAMYRRVTAKIMNKDYQLAGGNINKFIQSWRGVPETADPKYYSKVRAQLQPKPAVVAVKPVSQAKPSAASIKPTVPGTI